jgi:hypothetical protein
MAVGERVEGTGIDGDTFSHGRLLLETAGAERNALASSNGFGAHECRMNGRVRSRSRRITELKQNNQHETKITVTR